MFGKIRFGERLFRLPRVHFFSLRTKLIAGFALVILLCLGLAGSSFIYQLRDYQQEVKLNRLTDLVLPLSLQVRLLEGAGASEAQIAGFLEQQASEVGVRILLLDRQGVVISDTGHTLTGRGVRIGLEGQVRRSRGTLIGVYREEGRPSFYFVASTPTRAPAPAGSERFLSRTDQPRGIAVAVPEQTLGQAWLELLPSLGVAGTIALVLSIGFALILAGSIARPVGEMTRAAEEMARGNYDQTIHARGRDEISRLAAAFNTMAREVGRSHQLLRDFLANASHELKTPLTSIQGFSQAMVDGTVREAEDYASAAQIVHDEAARMRRLVDDLLYLSRLESGQVEMNVGEFNLVALLRAQHRRIERQAEAAGITLQVISAEQMTVAGDEGRLEQVLVNLLDNALRFTPRGGTITIRAEAAGRQCDVTIRVHNTGSYIPPTELPHIFERFYQVDRSRSQEGSGLGLAIVREIVLAHGGTVQVESNPTTGTEFVVTLPKAARPVRSTGRRSPSDQPTAGAEAHPIAP